MPTTTTPTRLLSEMTTMAPATATAPYVSLVGVGKTYASPRGPVAALVDINLDIRPHEFVSVVGPSGCGKSTLLQAASPGLENVGGGQRGGRRQAAARARPTGWAWCSSAMCCLDWRDHPRQRAAVDRIQPAGRASKNANARSRCSTASACNSFEHVIPASSPAACASAPRSAARCSPIPNCC